MEKQIMEFFDSETMPDACARRIEAALKSPKVTRRPMLRALGAVAAALLLVLAIGNFDTLRVYAAEVYQQILHAISPSSVNEIGRVESGITVSFTGTVFVEAEADPNYAFDRYLPDTQTHLAQVDGDRLYFIANGERIDITDQCSMDAPFIYAAQEPTGRVYYLVVGGTPENWGEMELIWDPDQVGVDEVGWRFFVSYNATDPDTHEYYAWAAEAMEQLDFSMEP